MEQPPTVLQPPGTDPVARAEARPALTDLLTRTTDDLPVHQLEIDRSFVTGLADRATDRTVVRTITTLGHDLGLEVVARGRRDARGPRPARRAGRRPPAGLAARPPGSR